MRLSEPDGVDVIAIAARVLDHNGASRLNVMNCEEFANPTSLAKNFLVPRNIGDNFSLNATVNFEQPRRSIDNRTPANRVYGKHVEDISQI